jgi:hypothetical protein
MKEKYFISTDIVKFLFDEDIINYMSERIYAEFNYKLDFQLFLFLVIYYINNFLDADIIFEDLNEQEFLNKTNERINDLINLAYLFINENKSSNFESKESKLNFQYTASGPEDLNYDANIYDATNYDNYDSILPQKDIKLDKEINDNNINIIKISRKIEDNNS